MNSKIERFEALDKVIINLETEAEKLGAFSGLVSQVSSANQELDALIKRQASSHHDLKELIAFADQPVEKIQLLTEQLAKEIEQVNHKQSAFNKTLKVNQTEQFNALLDRQSSITKVLSTQVEDIGEKVRTTCHDDLEQLIKSSEEPLQKIKTLTEQLQQEITGLNAQQSEFQDRQLAGQGEYFQAFLKKQESASEKLQDGIQTITQEVKKIDPDLLEEMRIAFKASQSELAKIRGLLEQAIDSQQKQTHQIHNLKNQLTETENTVNKRFTKLDLSAEKIRHLPDTLEQLKVQLQEAATETRQYQQAEQEYQRELTAKLHSLSKFAGFSRFAFLVLASLVIMSFFIGA